MVRSDGNGSYIVDKNLWKAAIAIISLLIGLVAYGGGKTLDDLKDVSVAVSKNQAYDEAQEARIFILEKQLDRIEEKLDKALQK